MDERDKQIQYLVNINLQLMEGIRFLESRVLELEKELAKYRNPITATSWYVNPKSNN